MKRTVQKLANILKEKELRIAFAESMTCGFATHSVSNISGTSDFFAGSIICYDENVKTGLFKIKVSLLKKYTAESQQVTDALAKNLSTLIVADIYAAITGLAAPGGSETKEKPVGTVFFSVYFKKKLYKHRKVFRGTPSIIKQKACDEIFKFIISIIK